MLDKASIQLTPNDITISGTSMMVTYIPVFKACSKLFCVLGKVKHKCLSFITTTLMVGVTPVSTNVCPLSHSTTQIQIPYHFIFIADLSVDIKSAVFGSVAPPCCAQHCGLTAN